jgi:hypothetical protein
MTGASLTLVIVTDKAWLVTLVAPSVAVTTTTYTLSVLASAFVSKSRAVIVSTPVELPIVKNAPSVPDFVHVTVSLAANVVTAVVLSAIEIDEVAPVALPGPVIVGATASETIGVDAVMTTRADSEAVSAAIEVDVPVT